MSARRWLIQVDRVVVRGAPAGSLDATALRAAVDGAVREALLDAQLPPGRSVRAAVAIAAGPELATGPAGLGRAVGGAIARAVDGGARRG